ncbi:hypothetical protein Tco_0505570 [Tanacetum coccineum]
MLQTRKRSPRKRNFSANHEGKCKSINGKRFEQADQVRIGTIIGMIRGYISRKRSLEQAEQWLDNEISFPSTPGCQLVDSPIILEALIEGFLVRRIYVDGGSSSEVIKVSYPIGTINLNVTMGEPERLRTIPMEFAVVKSHSPYNVILGQTGLRSLRAVASTIHSMIKFPTANGIATVTTKTETLHECRRMEEAQGPILEGRIAFPQIPALGSEGTTNTSREEIQGQTKEGGKSKDTIQLPPNPPEKDTQIDEKIKGKDKHPKRPLESKPLEKHADAFSWTLADMIGIPCFIAEHELKTYPHIEPRVQRKQSIASDRRKIVKDEIAEWLKVGIVRKVCYPTWVANHVLVKKLNDSWRMCIDFKELNKSCLRDLYPLPEIDWKIESLMGFKYKCFLNAYKGLVNTIFEGQMGRNLEAFVDDMVIKSKTEPEMIKDVKETLLTLKKVNHEAKSQKKFLSEWRKENSWDT